MSLMQRKHFYPFIKACATTAALGIPLMAASAFSQTVVPTKDSLVSGATTLPQFVAISIHPLKEDTTSYGGGFFGTTYRAHAYTTQMLIWEATGIDDSARIKGMPKWASETKYDTEATVDVSDRDIFSHLNKSQRRAMVLSILSTRFHFAFHYEDAELPVLDLVVAKGGTIHMTPYVVEDTPHPHPECLWAESRPDYRRAEGCGMKDLANTLNQIDGFEVIDQTGLSGRYSFDLHFDDTATSSWVNGHRFAATNKENAEWPSLYSALPGQLGLKLTKGKAALPVLVIDSINPPTEN